MRQRVRHRVRHRERQSETVSEADRETERDRERVRQRERERDIVRQRGRQRERHTERHKKRENEDREGENDISLFQPSCTTLNITQPFVTEILQTLEMDCWLPRQSETSRLTTLTIILLANKR